MITLNIFKSKNYVPVNFFQFDSAFKDHSSFANSVIL